MRNKTSFRFVVIFVLIAMLAASPLAVGARHAWSKYHWARTANPLSLHVIDSMTPDWDDNLNAAVADWDESSVLSLTQEAGSSDNSTRQACAPVTGKVRACNYTYGINGWLGVAQIWITTGNHIAQGTAKMNDSYLASGYTETNKQHVICQEIGHDWGLGHQSETGADLNTCMDYANSLDNPSPNQGDYDQLLCIYDPAYKGVVLTSGPHRCRGTGHLDSFNSSASNAPAPAGFANADVHAQENWGNLAFTSDNGRVSIYERDFGNGYRIVTFVFWAE